MRLANVVVDGAPRLAFHRPGEVHPVPGLPASVTSTDSWLRAPEEIGPLLQAAWAEVSGGAGLGWLPEHQVTFLPVVTAPGKVLAVGRNYQAHRDELGDATERLVPPMFMKSPSSLTGHRADVTVPDAIHELDHEVELAVVIGRPARCIEPAGALDVIAGYAVANDITDRSVQRHEARAGASPTVAKNLPAATPLGPAIVTPDEVADPQDLALWCEVDGDRRQHDRTSSMIHTVAELVAWTSQTGLVPGDVILTGTPAGVGMATGRYLAHGEEVAVAVSGVGELRNRIVLAPLVP